MITKENFDTLSKQDAVRYVYEHYCMDDINDACESWTDNNIEEDTENQDMNPFQLLLNYMVEDDIKDYLWEEIITQCEEIDPDAPEIDTDCID